MKYPQAITLHQVSGILSIVFDDASFELPAEYLRVYSPSAEVKGHHPSEEKIEQGKKNIKIQDIKPIGHYALKIIFDDGHCTGLFTWDYLYTLGEKKKQYWQRYLQKLKAIAGKREP